MSKKKSKTIIQNTLIQFLYVILLTFFCLTVRASNLKISPELKKAGWQLHHFEEATQYQVIGSDQKTNTKIIQATSKAAASGLVKEKSVNLTVTPILNWSWMAEKLIQTPKPYREKSKSGDDYTARIYVVAKGRFFWQTKALNYVWSSQHSVENYWDSPYTDNSVMIVVENGESNLGKWLSYQRNIRADFKKYFDMNVKEIDAVAIMTDTDNTLGEAKSSYQNIHFSPSTGK